MGLRTWLGLKQRRVTEPPRSKIFFLHMPKTGGVSLSAAIAPAFPFWAINPDPCMSARNDGKYPPIDVIIDAMRFRPDRVHYMYGHFHLSCAAMMGPAAKTVTVLRHPVDRMISYYRWWYMKQGLTPETFLERFRSDGFNMRYDNEMCRRLAGTFDYSAGSGAADRLHSMLKADIADPAGFLDAAKRGLEKCHFVATLDTLPRLAARLSAELEYKVKLPYENKSKAPNEIASMVLERVEQDCKLDLALYEHAKAIAAG